METKQRNYLLGRATAIIERETDMPHRVVGKIAAHPIEMCKCWLQKATIAATDELVGIMSQIDEIPTSLTIVQQGDFWMGYYKQNHDCSFRDQVGNSLKAARLSKGMSMEQLAQLADVTETTISKIENGKWSVSLDLLERVCISLDVRLSLVDA